MNNSMDDYKFAIYLLITNEDQPELADSEFSSALALPKKLFPQNLLPLELRYKEYEEALAQEICLQLNKEIQQLGYKCVEFKIKEINFNRNLQYR